MNRGYDGKAIFSNLKEKELFLELLGRNAKLKMCKKKMKFTSLQPLSLSLRRMIIKTINKELLLNKKMPKIF
jgi:hypothetical protein